MSDGTDKRSKRSTPVSAQPRVVLVLPLRPVVQSFAALPLLVVALAVVAAVCAALAPLAERPHPLRLAQAQTDLPPQF